MLKVKLFILILVSMSSCVGTMQTARTNGAGKFQIGVEPGAFAYEVDGSQPDNSDIKLPRIGDVEYAPYLNLSGRYGVSERVDMGLRLGVFNYEVQAKVMVTDPAAIDSVAVSIAPSVIIIPAGLFVFPVKVLVGIPVGRDEVVFTPQVTPYFDGGDFAFSAGGSLAYALKFEGVTLLPEIRVEAPISSFSSELAFNVGFGFLFGGR